MPSTTPQSPGTSSREHGVFQLRGEVGDGRFVVAARCRARSRRASRRRARSAPARRRRARRRSPAGSGAPWPRWPASRAGPCRAPRQHLDVRDHRQHAVAHLLLEAVHHRQHDDQRRHAERDAEHRHAGDEGDEAVAATGAAGACVAPADLKFVGPVHWGAMLPERVTPRRFEAKCRHNGPPHLRNNNAVRPCAPRTLHVDGME